MSSGNELGRTGRPAGGLGSGLVATVIAVEALAGRREFGFDNRDFSFEQYGARFDGKCLAVAPWPDYRVKEVRTGQFIPGQGQLWQGKLTVEQ